MQQAIGDGPKTLACVPGRGPDGTVLSVLAKRTYQLTSTQTLALGDDQLALRIQGTFGESEGHLLQDVDTWPWKANTDIVVRGHAYPKRGESVSDVRITCGAFQYEMLVFGDRQATLDSRGQVRFSEPDRFERIPLEYSYAYGGIDWDSTTLYPNSIRRLKPFICTPLNPDAYDPCAYPRNIYGRGYVLRNAGRKQLEVALPNLEDPTDRLTPERLLVAEPRMWHTAPVPAGTTWVSMNAFARYANMGMFPFGLPVPDQLVEFQRGYLSRDLLKGQGFAAEPLVFGIANGASRGLCIPYVRPGERVTASGVCASGPVAFMVPSFPRVFLSERDARPTAAECVISTTSRSNPTRVGYWSCGGVRFVAARLCKTSSTFNSEWSGRHETTRFEGFQPSRPLYACTVGITCVGSGISRVCRSSTRRDASVCRWSSATTDCRSSFRPPRSECERMAI